jgi:F0F1-type ATP synthase assembly protein I
MKQILKLGYSRYIHLDSYNETHETRGGTIALTILTILISSFTVGAMLGIDITQFSPTQNHGTTHRIDR